MTSHSDVDIDVDLDGDGESVEATGLLSESRAGNKAKKPAPRGSTATSSSMTNPHPLSSPTNTVARLTPQSSKSNVNPISGSGSGSGSGPSTSLPVNTALTSTSISTATSLSATTTVSPLTRFESSDDDHDQVHMPVTGSPSHSGGSATPHYGFGRQRSLRHYQLVALGCYWFGWSFLWLPLMIVIIPKQVVEIAGESGKGANLSYTLLLGSLASIIFAPAFGSYSDSSINKYGRRRPYMAVGTAFASVALLLMAVSSSLEGLRLSFLLLSIANNMILAPYSALVPDAVPPPQRGTASGYLGIMSMMGYMMGGFLMYRMEHTGIVGAYFILMIIHAASMAVTCYVVEEEPIHEIQSPVGIFSRLASVMTPLRSHDFRFVFFTRFLIQMGILTVQEYLQFYLKDAIVTFTFFGTTLADNAEQAVSILFFPVLLGALASSLTSGIISDKQGGKRKMIVYISGGTMSICCIMFGITRWYTLDIFLGTLFGVGFGAFATMDWAMATDVLPHPHEFAKDMGIWSLAIVLPQVLATPVAGNILDYFQSRSPDGSPPEHTYGYTLIFLVAVVYFASGTFFVKYVDSVH